MSQPDGDGLDEIWAAMEAGHEFFVPAGPGGNGWYIARGRLFKSTVDAGEVVGVDEATRAQLQAAVARYGQCFTLPPEK